MALTTERIRELYQEVQRRAAQLDAAGQYSFGGWFPIAVELVEAEVRKDDEALIRQMLEALETCGDGDGYNGPYQYYETVPVEEAVAAARARLEKAP